MAIQRPTKSGRRSPAHSELQKKLWQNPEHRARMIEARSRTAEDRRTHPNKYSRLGVPNGMRKADAMKAWERAAELSDTVMRGFELQGIVPAVVIPDSDDAIAKAALHEACRLALGPGNLRSKLMAAATVLKYTKAPPLQRVSATVPDSAEEWLRATVQAAATAESSPNNLEAH